MRSRGDCEKRYRGCERTRERQRQRQVGRYTQKEREREREREREIDIEHGRECGRREREHM